MNYIEFDYETLDGQILTIYGETDNNRVFFKAYDENNKQVKRTILKPFDIENIEDLIYNMSEPEIEYESDFYDRYDE